MTAADAGLLDNLAVGVFDDPLDRDATTELLSDDRHHLVIAMDEGLVVGFTSAVHHVHPDKPRPELWINEVGVAPSHQKRGIAKAMMSALLERGAQSGCKEAWVLTDRGNLAAMRLYRASGGIVDRTDQVMFSFALDDKT
ncbi:GNAT family N-acetyltransferase [Cognatiyoonia sp. IB215446]|uniref:GNAT family N-acetyltransferase n=1 Tax=Cognatiyoonia sp. IB215446 TaxID=3097355 RepID=UPI002A14168D|nr:GNAT family N-acetyltransferase [Cognatiyoonia sp. IB215446]MDX8348553.1 GNAT family N-acetyltransferase [Cognatiyoonia sp. IB215446]